MGNSYFAIIRDGFPEIRSMSVIYPKYSTATVLQLP